MNIAFAFSSDDLKPAQVDAPFQEQAKVLAEKGFPVWTTCVDEDKFVTRGQPAEGFTIVYRGWMLSKQGYERFVAALSKQGARPFTSVEQYLNCHHLPGWYDAIAGLTPETAFFDADADLVEELDQLGWDEYFVKDHVKSLKTGSGSIISRADDIPAMVEEMRRYRGTIEGGVAVRRVEDFIADSELRFFVRDGQIFSAKPDDAVPEIVKECVIRARHLSNFFSVDVIKNRMGQYRIVEIGDGQVSDIVGWTAEDFVRVWAET